MTEDTFGMRIDLETLDKLDKLAAADQRSKAAEVRILIQAEWDRRHAAQAPEPAAAPRSNGKGK